MPRFVPAHAGFFRVTLRVSDDLEVCEATKAALDGALTSMAETGFGTAIAAMPSTRVERGDAYSELILEWVRQPADGSWEAVEGVIETVKLVMPDLLAIPDELRVTVVRELAVGRDVILTDEQVAEHEKQAEGRAGIGDTLPPEFLDETGESS